MPSVDWRHSRKRLILPIAIFAPLAAPNPNLCMRTIGLLDTGATGTGIRADIVDELGLERKGQRRVTTANGLLMAAEVMVRIGFIAGDHTDPDYVADQQQPYVLERSTVAFELAAGFDYPLLIGMDVLGQCDLSIRRDGSATLVLP